MSNITGNENRIKMGNSDYTLANLDARITETRKSKEIIRATSKSGSRIEKQRTEDAVTREMNRYASRDAVDPYDNTPGSKKVPRDKIIAISNGQYTASLLEKILKASDNSQFQSSTLKFQEQTLNYMQSISTDIKSIAELLKPKTVEQEDEDNEFKLEVSNLAKALSELNVENIAKEIGKSIYSKMDSGGYGDLIKTMYQSVKDSIQGGDFTQMVKGMIQSSMLKTLPKEMQQTIQEFREDPVKLMQRQINKLGSSNNKVLRDIFGSSYRGMAPDLTLKEKKIDMSAKAMFDNKFYTSVTRVIPEQLYRIVAALEGTEIRSFDWDKQGYLGASEVAAKAAKNNFSNSYEALESKAMSIFSTMFEQAFEKQHGKLNFMFQTDAEGKILKDQKTGHVKFKNSTMKEIITKISTSKLLRDEIINANPAWVVRQIGITTNDPDRLGQYYDNVAKLQRALKLSDFEDRADVMSDIETFRSDIDKRSYDNSADFLTPAEKAVYDRIIYSDNLTAAEKNNLIDSIGKRGVHVWGTGGGSGKSKKSKGSGPLGPSPGGAVQGANTITDTDAIMNAINNADLSNRKLTDKELNDARMYVEDLAAGKRTGFKQTALSQKTPEQKFKASLIDMYGYGAIDKANYDRLMGSGANINDRDYQIGRTKLRVALETFKILQEAGYTADAQAARLDISEQQAQQMGYISSPNDLIDCINDDGTFDPSRLRNKRLTYLQGDDFEFVKKLARENKRGVLGNGSIDKQISNTLSGIFGDPNIAGKAGLAVGSAAGLGVAKLLRDQGIITSPKFGYVLAGLGGGLMTLQRTRNFMNNIFGPEGDIKGVNGFTNKEIFLAKAMSKYLPAIGVGGKAATMIMKASSAFGPLGKAFGLIAGPILGYGIGMASTSLIQKGRDWLFNPERDPKSKIAKFASFLKDIPGVKKLFALSDTRSDENLHLDALNKLEAFYTSKFMSYKASENPSPSVVQAYTQAIQKIKSAKDKVSGLIRSRDNEARKEDADQSVIDTYNTEINNVLLALDSDLDGFKDTLSIDGKTERQALYENERDAQDSQNRMRAAADAEYNKPSEDHIDRINDIVQRYWEANDEHKDTMRSVLTGDTNTIYDSISDPDMKSELRQIMVRAEAGNDVTAEFRAWKQRLRASNPNDYEAITETTNKGTQANRLKEDLMRDIMREMREVEHFTGTEEELRYIAQTRMMGYLRNKGLGGHLRDIFKNVSGDASTRFRRLFDSSMDSDDIREQNRAMEFWNSVDEADETDDLDEGGQGGRGDKPIKMRNLSNKKFKSGEDLSVAGCSVAALTNALVYMGVDSPEPDTLIPVANKYLTRDGGVTSEFIIDVCNRIGITVDIFNRNQNTFTAQTFKSFKPGKGSGLMVLLKNQHNRGYHFITIKSVSGTHVTIDDPEQNGLQELTSTDIIARTVEIISLKTKEQKALKESAVTVANKAKIVASSSNALSAPTNTSTSTSTDVSDVGISGQAGLGGSTGSNVAGLLSGLIDALQNAVFNVRIVDDFTLPLKMGDATAALAVSKQQIASAASPYVKSHAQRMKQMMLGKDIQNEMQEQDLVQEAILNGGLVAGGSTGAGGRGGNAVIDAGENVVNGGEGGGKKPKKPAGTLWDRIKQAAPGAIVAGMTGLGAAVTGGAQWLASKISLPMFNAGGKNITDAKNNLFHKYTEEEQKQVLDENGNVIQSGQFRDVGGSVRSIRDGLNLIRGGVAVHGAVGAGIGKLGNMALNHGGKLLTPLGKALTGNSNSMLVNTFVKALTTLPAKLADMLLGSDIFVKICGGESVAKTMISNYIDPLKKFFGKVGEKLSTALAKKAGAEMGKKTMLKSITSFMKKMPLLDLIVLIPSIGMSAYTGYTKAHEYLKVTPDKVNAFKRIGMGIAKTIYDNGIDLLLSIGATIMPALQPLKTAASILLAVFRSIVTFPMILEALGITKKDSSEEGSIKNAEEAVKLENENMEKQINGGPSTTIGSNTTTASTSDGIETVSHNVITARPVKPEVHKRNVTDITSANHSFTARHEGFRNKVYRDSEGKLTIGYGFNLDSGRFSKEQVDRWTREGISENEARGVLDAELERTKSQLDKYDWFHKLDPVRQGAVIDMSYNMGIGWVNDFKKTVAAIEAGDFNRAADEILNSKYARQTGSRATEIAELIRHGAGGSAEETSSSGQPIALSSGWGSPVKGRPFVTSAFGPRNIPKASNPHKGVDLRGNFGDPIFASKDGTVEFAGGEYGTILIKHADGTSSRYLHSDQIFVKPGDVVKQGQQIGTIGGRGPKGAAHYQPHLHFETMIKSKRVDPFIELGLTTNDIKLPPKFSESESRENIAYLQRNKWLQDKAKTDVNNKLLAVDTSKPSANKEAGGPPDSYYMGGSSNTQIIKYEDVALRQYVQRLDQKFDQMIELLTKLVTNSDEKANNIMSEALATARI